MTWTRLQYIWNMQTSSVQGSILRVNDNTLIFAGPDSTDGERQRMTIWVSHDDAVTWTKTKAVYYGYSSYSDMTLIGPDTVLLTFVSDPQHISGHERDGCALQSTVARKRRCAPVHLELQRASTRRTGPVRNRVHSGFFALGQPRRCRSQFSRRSPAIHRRPRRAHRVAAHLWLGLRAADAREHQRPEPGRRRQHHPRNDNPHERTPRACCSARRPTCATGRYGSRMAACC